MEGLVAARIYFITWQLLSRDHSQLIRIHFLSGRIICEITSKMGKDLYKLLCFGSFAGA